MAERLGLAAVRRKVAAKGGVQLALTSGDFRVEEGKTYRIVSGKSARLTLAAGPKLVVPLELDGETLVRIGLSDESSESKAP